VSDILGDMKNKFAMVGLAYAFRNSLEQAGGGSSPEMRLEAFQETLSKVGMVYDTKDLRRMFNAFDNSGNGSATSIEILNLTEQLTGAARPSTPIQSVLGSAHFSEVNSLQGDANELKHNLAALHNGTPTHHGGHHKPSGDGLPECPPAPSEEPEPENNHMHEYHNPPVAPEDDGTHEDDPRPPPAEIGEHDDALPAVHEAPPEEDEEGDAAPPEEPDHEDSHKEEEPSAPPSENQSGHGQPQSHGSQAPSMQPSPMAGGMGGAGKAGKQKAVSVGINYIGHKRGVLAGCINDSDTFIQLLTAEFGYQVADIRQLRDDHPQRMPTRRNIAAALHWLVEGASAGDHLFFHYSGHGSQQTDASHDELDGRDETLVPCDYQHAGMLSDDEIRQILVAPLQEGVRLTCVMDCCHSGTAMDLPYKVKITEDGNGAEVKRKPKKYIKNPSKADVVMISGCMDNQTSADIGAGQAGNALAAGAMTTAFKTVIMGAPTASYHKMLNDMRAFLKQRKYKQFPQLTSEQFLNLTDCFMPEADKPEEAIPQSLRPPARRALSIGINYLTLWPGRGRLSGCINDSETIVGMLKDTFGFQDSMITRLRDDRANMMPTKANIIQAFGWLTGGAAPGDELFLHYSGHGGQMEDKRGDEADGKDETLMPCDFQQAGQITDDELYTTLVQNLPKGCKFWVVLDCCHSGSALDLRFKVNLSTDGRTATLNKRPKRRAGSGMKVEASKAHVIMLSGCKDTQTSADIQAGSLGAAKAAGAMTTALRHVINPDISCHKLVQTMRRYLKRNHFNQVPQMSSEQFVQLDSSYVNYEAGKKSSHQRTIAVAPMGSPMQPMGSPMRPVDNADYIAASRINRLEEELNRLKVQGGFPLSPGGGMNPGYPMSSPKPIGAQGSPQQGFRY